MAFLTLSQDNLLTFPSQFDNAAWTKTRASITADATTAPDGTTTAEKLVEDGTASATHKVSQVYSGSVTTYTVSVYAKAAERDEIQLSLTNQVESARQSVRVDLTDGSVVSGSGTVASVGDGWYRISATGSLNAGDTGAALFVYLSNGSGITYNGDGSSGVYLWGASLVTGATDVPVAWGGALTRYAEIGTRAVAFDGTARSSVRSRKRVWEGITTAPMSQTDADSLYDLLVGAPPLLAVGDMTRHLEVQVHPSNVREAGVWTNASGAYRYSLQFDLREV